MTYYAVTNDPNELMHFGIKGMKWGIRRTDAQLGHPRHIGSGRRKPRSAAYKKAESKLHRMMKSGIEKAEANWRAYNSPEAKYKRQTNRYIEQARKGKLKYGKLTDDQVRRVTERLDMERQARQLANTEKTWKHKLGTAIGEGIVTGIGKGVEGRVSEWISRGGKLKTRRMEKDIDEYYDVRKEKRNVRNELRKEAGKAHIQVRKTNAVMENTRKRQEKAEKDKIKKAAKYGYEYDDKGNLLIGSRYDGDGNLLLSSHDRAQQYRLGSSRMARRQDRRARAREGREMIKRQSLENKALKRESKDRDDIAKSSWNKAEEMTKSSLALAKAKERDRLNAAEAARQREGKNALLKEAEERQARQQTLARRETNRKEAERQRRITEQGYRDREERLGYKQRVSSMANLNAGPDRLKARREAAKKRSAQKAVDDAWRSTEQRYADAREKEAYRARVSDWAKEIDQKEAERASRQSATRRRRKTGKRN